MRRLVWPGIHVSGEDERRAIADKLAESFDAIPVFIPEKTFEAYYAGFANSALWPAWSRRDANALESARGA